MSDKILYFPYINVPNNLWTSRSLLYWDSITSIVPTNYNRDELTPFMDEAINKGLINMANPYEYICQIPAFDNSFLSLLDSPDFKMTEKRENFQKYKTELHTQKFGTRILDELVREGIAIKKNYDWYLVEPYTARLFMLYLASLIASIGDFTPATDNQNNLVFSLNHKDNKEIIKGKFINDLIPYPIDLDLSKLLDFREKYHNQLNQFKDKIEDLSIVIANIEDERYRDDLYNIKLKEINTLKDEIFLNLKNAKFKAISKSNVLSFAGGVATMAVSGGNPLGIMAGLLTAGASINAGMENYRNQIATNINKSYSYLALIDRKFEVF